MKINNTTDEEVAITEVLKMSTSELELLEFTKYKLCCAVIGCTRHWNVKDFGIAPYYLIRRKFYDLSNVILVCKEHFKLNKNLPLKANTSDLLLT